MATTNKTAQQKGENVDQKQNKQQSVPVIKVGSIVKWVGQANGGATPHEGKVVRIEKGFRGDVATVMVDRKHKKTGCALKPQRFTPRVSALTLVQ